jgi:hypothetical protein
MEDSEYGNCLLIVFLLLLERDQPRGLVVTVSDY